MLQQCQSPPMRAPFVCLFLIRYLSPKEVKSNFSTFKNDCMWVGHTLMQLFPLLNRKSFQAVVFPKRSILLDKQNLFTKYEKYF